jgi:hypothetical protein
MIINRTYLHSFEKRKKLFILIHLTTKNNKVSSIAKLLLKKATIEASQPASQPACQPASLPASQPASH